MSSNFYECFRHASKIVPKLLNFDQKQCRMDIAQEVLTDLLKNILTGDESWTYGYDIETKTPSSQWKRPKEPRPKKARQVGSIMKVLKSPWSSR